MVAQKNQSVLTLCLLGSLMTQFTMAGRAVSEDMSNNNNVLAADISTLVVDPSDLVKSTSHIDGTAMLEAEPAKTSSTKTQAAPSAAKKNGLAPGPGISSQTDPTTGQHITYIEGLPARNTNQLWKAEGNTDATPPTGWMDEAWKPDYVQGTAPGTAARGTTDQTRVNHCSACWAKHVAATYEADNPTWEQDAVPKDHSLKIRDPIFDAVIQKLFCDVCQSDDSGSLNKDKMDALEAKMGRALPEQWCLIPICYFAFKVPYNDHKCGPNNDGPSSYKKMMDEMPGNAEGEFFWDPEELPGHLMAEDSCR